MACTKLVAPVCAVDEVAFLGAAARPPHFLTRRRPLLPFTLYSLLSPPATFRHPTGNPPASATRLILDDSPWGASVCQRRSNTTRKAVQDFIARWEASGSAERANYTMFLTELCALLGVPGPEPTRPDDRDNAYVFERAVPMDDGDGNTTVGRIDLYKRGCFVLEAKQGSTAADGADDLLSPPSRAASAAPPSAAPPVGTRP